MSTVVLLPTFNRPELLERQVSTLEKHLIGDFQIVVIHDSRETELCAEFDSICKKRRLEIHHRTSPTGKSASQYHADSIQLGYQIALGNWRRLISPTPTAVSRYLRTIAHKRKRRRPDLLLFLDHDMFLVEDFDIEEYMEGYDVAGCRESRGSVGYYWPGLLVMRTASVSAVHFNFNPGIFYGEECDTGGGTCELIRASQLRHRFTTVNQVWEYRGVSLQEGNQGGFPFELHADGKFLHFRNASAWHSGYGELDPRKLVALNAILDPKEDDN